MTVKKTTKPTQKMFADDVNEQPMAPTDEAIVLGSPDHNLLELPSKGKLGYPSQVEYRDIMVKDEEVLSLATPATYTKTLNTVLKGILNNCSFYERMSIYDRDYALIWLWANNYTPVKTVEVTCPSCGNVDSRKVNLTALEIDDVKDNLPIPFVLPLKNASVESVEIRHNTVADELFVEDYMNKNKNSNFELLMLVSSIQLPINMQFEAKLKWVRENVSSKEMGHIRNFHRYFKFGVKDRIEHTCSACSEVTHFKLPFQAEDVLFPTVQSDFEELLRASEST